jgi:NCAIR mutase (PurE)-related protein
MILCLDFGATSIFGERKTTEQISGILKSMYLSGARDILVTRLSAESATALGREFEIDYHAEARIAVAFKTPGKPLRGCVVIASGGTVDMSVCEEAAITAEALGSRVHRLYDVGVSGIHRLLSNMDILNSARVIVAVAGMEGALPSVIGGLVDCPVIAVPTSVGYGASFGGVAALLTMLNSCASGISVVNIDNGFGAGYLANMINNMTGLTG